MRHRKKSEKFSRSRAQRKALKKSLLRSLIISERIRTTEAKAKAIRSDMDKLITWGKRGDLAARRLSYRVLGDYLLVKKLFGELAPRFTGIQGGYTRVFDIGYRKGDGALLSILELTRLEKKKKRKGKKKQKEVSKTTEQKTPRPTEEKSKKSFVSGVKNIFKKERDVS